MRIGPSIVALAWVAGACSHLTIVPRRCAEGFDASFIQPTDSILRYGADDWAAELAVLEGVGVRTVVLQWTGDMRGSYDGMATAPVRALLAAAHSKGIDVYLGLFSDPWWFGIVRAGGVAPPLDSPRAIRRLVALCQESAACAGWYLPEEIDDLSWAAPEATAQLRTFLERSAALLRLYDPHHPIAIAPFPSGAQGPEQHARWWGELLRGRPVDVLMLQDRVGTGRAVPIEAGRYLAALGPVAERRQIELWSVIEVFKQVQGPPFDGRPFLAEPATFRQVRASLEAERPLVKRVVAFTVLDHMHPRGSRASRNLYGKYAAWCEATSAGERASFAADNNEGEKP